MTGENSTDTVSHLSNDLEATKCGDDQSKLLFKSGDIVWIKIRGSSWWPAQVFNEENVPRKPNKKAKDEILVRVYGTYEYLYVDPIKSSSKFANFLKKENMSITEVFEKTLEEDISRMKSADKRKNSEPEGETVINEASKINTMRQDGSIQLKAKGFKGHPKSVSPVTTKSEPLEASNPSARRVRVMRTLGLIAPLGSPFRKRN